MPQRPAYNPEQIETKWQKRWLESGVFNAEFPSDKPKYYCLIEFPYPSGNGLHVGHPRSNTALDIIARKRRMEGYNVLYPIGYDAFGLPTENFAIKNKVHPAVVTKKNIDHFRQQLQRPVSFDYTRMRSTPLTLAYYGADPVDFPETAGKRPGLAKPRCSSTAPAARAACQL